MNLFFRQAGSGQPLIILHGLFGSSDNWLSIAKTLSDRFSVYLVDQRNHGQSPHSEHNNYTLMAEDLDTFIRTNNIENPIIVGHSMGGKTIMKFAAEYTTPFKKMVVVDISPKYYPVHHQVILEGLLSIPLAELKSRNEADEILAGFITETDVRQFLLKNLYRNAEGAFAWRMNLPVLNAEIEEIGKAADETRICLKPTLFIKGAYSNYIKGGDEVLIKKIFPNSRIEIIESGHWVQAEKPVEFVAVLTQFCSE